MADGILGLGSSGSVDLNQELIDKLKEAETKAYIDPIDDDIEEMEAILEAVDEIKEKIAEFLAIIEEFDLYTTGTKAFEQVSASTSGTAASFDAADTSGLTPGTIDVHIANLAQRDVYQSAIINGDEDTLVPAGSIELKIGADEEVFTFSSDGTKTYKELVTEMNYNSGINASYEKVGDNDYRLLIKSSKTGVANKINITNDTVGLDLTNGANHLIDAKNMKATIDGTDYDVSSNKITLSNGLMISAVEEGDASIVLERDDAYLIEQINNVANSYNELVDLIDTYTVGDKDNPAVISDSSTLRTIKNDIRNMFFGSYGLEDEESAFNYGISFDNGKMEVDNAELSKAVTDNYDDLKELFVGYAEKEGLGTRLSTYVDDLDSLKGLMTLYEDLLDKRMKNLNEDHKEETEKIDTKYAQLAQQFADYTVIISQMEQSFSSLKLIMNMETSDN